jgi:2-amino-4-hydroxy-6-hydroxymethyldihydropteridine diphosphokinase
MMSEQTAARVFVAMGSNIEAERRLLQAARMLKHHFAQVRFSSCYRNPAFGFEGPDFINAVAELESARFPAQLLQTMHEIEAHCGREANAPKWAPRAMDLDLLLYGDMVGKGPGYTLPRPDLLKRVYMLGPLAELAPSLSYPPSGPTIGELWRQFPQREHVLQPVALNLNAA